MVYTRALSLYQFVRDMTIVTEPSFTTDFIDADRAAEILSSNASISRIRVGGMTLHHVGPEGSECLVVEGGCGAILLVKQVQAELVH